MQPLIDRIIDEWGPAFSLQLRVDHVQPNPKQARLVPPSDRIVLVRFEVKVGSARGEFRLCLPVEPVRKLVQNLATQTCVVNATSHSEECDGDPNSIDLRFVLAEIELPTEELLNLECGDIIRTDVSPGDLMPISIDGATKYLGRPGALKSHKAVSVEQKVQPTGR